MPSSTRYELSPWKLWTVTSGVGFVRECYPEDCGHVTPGAGTSESSTYGAHIRVTQGEGSGKDLPWRLWTSEARCRVWEDGHLEAVVLVP